MTDWWGGKGEKVKEKEEEKGEKKNQSLIGLVLHHFASKIPRFVAKE